ncbi:unnamed protein product (macronuclear) [Paramecium tetraurelia]|uniref:Uncharacterized protein n=1 Tax=Paramecium tetraurelia TaxID=5888 RepID=A0BE64_PARTE|nr:uncharacterized protein GSPATT00027863001 [Paramecium tetraurelia]CAK56831.1 unnamed protein product [Paramecium tetraurelia]|eukprot:XP_001424229.1 hypothetical protein (macronuclear) [Paramecium tetraurelia strain d4-2]
MQFIHDYAIIGEEENESKLTNALPLNQHFQNFSNLLQAQKERQKSKIFMPLDLNVINQTQNAFKSSARSSPRNYFANKQVPSVDKIMQKMAIKHSSHHQVPTQKEEFYERQIRWLNQIKQTNQVKNQHKINQEIQNCPFKPYTSPQQNINKEKLKENSKSILSPPQFKKPNKRNDSYSKIHLAKKQSLG